MARNSKFDDNRLVDLVVQYDRANPDVSKINATDVVSWAKRNLDGFEELQPYHLTRPSKGKEKECTKKINELNKLKKINTLGNSTLLTMPDGIDSLFNLTDVEQRRSLQKAKVLIEELRAALSEAKAQNIVLAEENSMLQSTVDELRKSEKTVESEKLKAQIRFILKTIEEEKLKDILAQAGISDGKASITTYKKYLEKKNEEIDFNELVMNTGPATESESNTITDILGGLLDD